MCIRDRGIVERFVHGIMNRGLRLGGEVLDVHVVVIEVDGDAIEHIVIAVSYTQLDVYKRQR